MEENNNANGPEEPVTVPNNVISLAQFKANKSESKPEHWPAAVPQGEPVVVTASLKDPLERRILVSTEDGDVIMDGYLGLSQTFLAIGDAKGQIKFAAAPGKWQYATDVTDNPDYQDTLDPNVA